MTISNEAIYRHIYTRPQTSLNRKVKQTFLHLKKQNIDLIKKGLGMEVKL